MKRDRIHLSLAFIAIVLGALAVSLLGWSSAPVSAVQAAQQAAATDTSTPTSGVITLKPTLTWMTPSNSDPIGMPGETVTVAGSGFDVSTGSIETQLELLSGANAGCPSAVTASPIVTETTAAFQASFTLDASATAGPRFVVCAFPSGKGTVIHSKTLTIVTPVLCAGNVCGSGATDSVALGTKSITVTGKGWEPVGSLVTVTLCCSASASPPATTPTTTATKAPQSQPTRTPIVVPTITIVPPIGQGLDRELSAQRASTGAPTTQTASIAPCADNPATGCFTVSLPLPSNAKVGDTFKLTAQAQGNRVVTPGPGVKIVGAGGQSGSSALVGLVAAVPELFLVIILLLLVMVGVLIWLATRREVGVGRQV